MQMGKSEQYQFITRKLEQGPRHVTVQQHNQSINRTTTCITSSTTMGPDLGRDITSGSLVSAKPYTSHHNSNRIKYVPRVLLVPKIKPGSNTKQTMYQLAKRVPVPIPQINQDNKNQTTLKD
jgi:hypothetical protein